MQISDTVWLAILGIITMVCKELLDILRAHWATERSKQTQEQLNAVTSEMAEVKTEMTEVKTNTNHLSQIAIEGGFLKGEKSGIQQERDRADAALQIPDSKIAPITPVDSKLSVEHMEVEVETMTVTKPAVKKP